MTGSSAGLDGLLRDHYSLIRAVCRRILQHDSDADDATQNALISIVRGYDSFDHRSSISTWIYRIATNAALDEMRRRQRRPMPLGSATLDSVEGADTRDLDRFHEIDAVDQLSQALAQIPEEYRVALVLRDVADLEYEEIGQVLGVPIGTVRSRIARGRGRLADILGNSAPVVQRQIPERQEPT